MGFLTMQGFFRTFGIMCTNFDSAFRLATFFIPNMIQYAGYMIPVFQMKRWLFWIVRFPLVGSSIRLTPRSLQFYINPLSYGNASLVPLMQASNMVHVHRIFGLGRE